VGGERGLGVTVVGERSARGMVEMTREEARGRCCGSRGGGGGWVVGEVVGGSGCGIWGGLRFWAAASSQAARAEGSTGQEEGGGVSVSVAMMRWECKVVVMR
jgi:hypothetical protein